ncbi:hypothetical protein A5712_21615 [Mycobacterium sp. E2327]|uniref:hypothetical protein n=1 Tax=Mycobacterium sp. E2327 TaxID=1834132 RepID=UPI0008015425|nr:hypothetical protein [Mycobacterium sp. E2327]OBI18590.1 hypothetical protein A5712_21615 [Mycobacterium sp. E2327]
MNTNLTVIREDSPDPADVPASGWAGAIVTVVTGKVMGEIIRSIFDGGTVADEVHIAIDGHARPLADVTVQTDDAQALRDLAAVAAFLANELAGPLGRGN